MSGSPVPHARRFPCPAPRCSTAPSTAARSPSAGAGDPPSPGLCLSQSGCVSAPPRPGASAGRRSRHTPGSPAAPSRSPWSSGGPPPSPWRSGGTWTETSWKKRSTWSKHWTQRGEQRHLLGGTWRLISERTPEPCGWHPPREGGVWVVKNDFTSKLLT